MSIKQNVPVPKFKPLLSVRWKLKIEMASKRGKPTGLKNFLQVSLFRKIFITRSIQLSQPHSKPML